MCLSGKLRVLPTFKHAQHDFSIKAAHATVINTFFTNQRKKRAFEFGVRSTIIHLIQSICPPMNY